MICGFDLFFVIQLYPFFPFHFSVDRFKHLISCCYLIQMSAETFTVIVLFEGQKYGLIIPTSATVLETKQEISVGCILFHICCRSTLD